MSRAFKITPGTARLLADETKERTGNGAQQVIRSYTDQPETAIALLIRAREKISEIETIPDAREVMAMANIGGDVARQQAKLAQDAGMAREILSDRFEGRLSFYGNLLCLKPSANMVATLPT